MGTEVINPALEAGKGIGDLGMMANIKRKRSICY